MIINYLSTVVVNNLDPNRVGLMQTIDVLGGGDKLTEVGPPSWNDQHTVLVSADNRNAEVTVTGAGYRTLDIVIARLENARYPIWREFYESTRNAAIFSMDMSAIRGMNKTHDCFRTDNNNGLKHYSANKGFSLNFSVRLLDT